MVSSNCRIHASSCCGKIQIEPIRWAHTGDAEFPYQAVIDGRRWTIRVNDFPEAPLYTLLIDDQTVLDVEDWPSAWLRP